MRTRFTDMMNITYPIVQGAMAWVSDAQLASAVSEAGGLGIIASGGRTAQWFREEIRLAREKTDKPFGVNLVLQDPDWQDKFQVILEEKPICVSVGAGNPLPLIEPLHEIGTKIFPVVPNIRLAKRVESAGADAIIIEGMEAGGHVGNISTMALMTQILPEISVPSIIAGGIADGRGLAAALLMGACGIQMGTRFYASQESSAHINAKMAIVNATDTDSVTTGRRGSLVRSLRNELTECYHKMEDEGRPREELSQLVRGTARKAPIEGDADWGIVQAGQSLSVIRELLPVATIIEQMMEEAREATERVQSYFVE